MTIICFLLLKACCMYQYLPQHTSVELLVVGGNQHGPLNWMMGRNRKALEHSALNGMFSENSSSQGSGVYAEEETERLWEPKTTEEAKEQCLPDTRLKHLRIQRQWEHTEGSQRFKSSGVPALTAGSRHGLPPLTNFCNWYLLARGKSIVIF